MSKQQFCRTKRTCFLTAGPMFSFLSLNMICSPYKHDHKNGAFINTTWWGLYNGPLHLSPRPKSQMNEFFTLADNTRGIRGHSRKLVKFWSTRDCCRYFFQTEWLIDGISWTSRWYMLPASMFLKDGRIKQGKQGWASSWTDPPSPRPPRWVFWLVRPHKVSY